MKIKKGVFGLILLIGVVTTSLYLSSVRSVGNSGGLTVGTTVGNLAPDFEALTIDGETLHLSELRGKTVLLNLFASWCGPCRAETPELVELAKDESDDLLLIGLNLGETPAAIETYRQDFNVPYPLLPDADGRLMELYRPIGLPTSWFIDPEGVIRYIHNGPMTATMIQKVLDDIRAGKQPDPFMSG